MKRSSLLITILGLGLGLILISCHKKELKVLTSIDKKDSLLVLTIENTTDSDLMLEFPSLDNFFYENEEESNYGESPNISKLRLIKLDNQNDIDVYKKINCTTMEKIVSNTKKSIPKFLLKKSKKNYFLKLKGYKSGNTIVLKDDGYKTFLNMLDSKKQAAFNKIKDQKCNGYKYFTGKFEFIPNKIILP
ncbi:hypothetical protein HZQ24_02195 [Elizabethkingia anophelis]|uniref:hypothetical protein n=1 Tax=Elizabethkingia anophelis TaxID=1117645 RepID=UPI00099B1CC4|nr:hypothetical protein [Elizabethkingia anophelis]MCT4011153.1 hypothetical protein [Elizabethkingia anophelis]MDV3898935.1 hypothetical protein [Elizabethkingia anophelis]OPC51084.1 hypothetical protein BAY06_07940 [Elizabethkingia anophelis]